MMAETTRPRSAADGSRPQANTPARVQRQYTETAVKTSERPRRCPWFADVVRLAAEPARCYGAWRGVAILCAGTGAWDRAAPIREAGRRAVTVLPPNTDPALIVWPAVRQWIVDVADVEAGAAIELGRLLIDSGAELIVITCDRLRGGLAMRRAQA